MNPHMGETTASAQVPSANDEIMTVDEVAAFLRVNRKTIYTAVAWQRIPHRRLGRRVLFSKQAVLAWLTGGYKEPRR